MRPDPLSPYTARPDPLSPMFTVSETEIRQNKSLRRKTEIEKKPFAKQKQKAEKLGKTEGNTNNASDTKKIIYPSEF